MDGVAAGSCADDAKASVRQNKIARGVFMGGLLVVQSTGTPAVRKGASDYGCTAGSANGRVRGEAGRIFETIFSWCGRSWPSPRVGCASEGIRGSRRRRGCAQRLRHIAARFGSRACCGFSWIGAGFSLHFSVFLMSASLTIAFIGTGVMGRSMAGHLQKAGHVLHVHNRTKAKATALLESGAIWHDSAGSAAAQADVVITMLGFPADVESSY